MIDEAIGKILGMAMAYLASAMGMFLAYVNYRRRIVKADKVMTPRAWAVIAVALLATVGGVLLVGQLAADQAADAAPAVVEVPEAVPAPADVPMPEESKPERSSWPWMGIVIPGAIFLFATVVTTGLHKHFSTHGD